MNGAQVASMQETILAVADGSIPRETARAMFQAAFPAVPVEQIDAMLDPLKSFKPKPKPSAPAPFGAKPATPKPAPFQKGQPAK